MTAQRDGQNRRQVYRAAAPGPYGGPAHAGAGRGARPPARPAAPRRPGRRRKRRGRGRRVVLTLFAVGLLCLLGGLALRSLLPRHYVVALDAGHGGSDPGASGVIGEVALTETTVRYLEELLTADENYTPVLCRQYGEGKDVNARAAAARWHGADLLLSVHGNSEESGQARGFECYPLPPGRAHHEDSLRLSGLLVDEMSAAGAEVRGENGIKYAYYFSDGSGGYEKVIRESSDRTVYSEKSFGVLEGAGCPAVLAEQCFVTNAADAEAFGSEAGCRLAAERYYRAICRYFGTQPTALEG